MFFKKKKVWKRIEYFADKAPLTEVSVGGKKLCIVKYEDAYYAVTNKCPHAGGIISQGELDTKGNVICPLHRFKFNCKNGYNASGEGFYLKHYPCEMRHDGLYVAL